MIDTFTPQFPANFSRLKHFESSPLHFRAACEAKLADVADDNEKPPYFRTGSAGHCLLFEPETFQSRFAIWEGDRRTKAYKAFAAELSHLTILNATEHEIARGIAEGIKRHPLARRILLQPGAAIEERIFWTDPETGLELAGTPDVVGVDLGDLKSSARKPKWFERWALDAHYPSQLAMYRDGLAELGREVRDVYMIFVESKPPFDAIVYHLTDEVLDYGRRLYRGWLRQLAECLETGQWRGQAPGPIDFDLPPYLQDSTPITLNGQEAF